jgi:hypothetical protein
MKNIQFKVIELPNIGKENFSYYGDKGYCITRVYSNRGNFLLKGFWGETKIFLGSLIKNGYKFYYQYSFYNSGKPRFTSTDFWNEKVIVLEPRKRYSTNSKNRNKFEFRKNSQTILSFKRLPNKWVPEFENL